MAEADPYPSGGALAAQVAAMAASLAAEAANRSREQWEEAGGARAQAQALERRATELAERDVAAYAVAREALAHRQTRTEAGLASEDQDARDRRLGDAVEDAAGPPFELARAAADIAELAALIAARGAGEVRADAAIATVLAAAAARAAARLVRVNLVVGDQQPAAAARGFADAAAAAAASADGSEW